MTPPNASFENTPSGGNYVAPRILTNVTSDMTVMKEETFGPVIAVGKVSSDEEAMKLMNGTDYGLTASVWTRDIEKGSQLVEQLEAGTVFINRSDYPSPVSIIPSLPRGCLGDQTNGFSQGSSLDGLEDVRIGMHPWAPGF